MLFGSSQGMTVLSLSYAAAAAAMFFAALYLFFRLRLFWTTTTILVGSLLLIYGPAFLIFTLSSGERGFLIELIRGTAGQTPNAIFSDLKARVPDLDAAIVAMNFSIALMYTGIVAGIEAVDRIIPQRITKMRSALVNWTAQDLQDDRGNHNALLIAISAVLLFMLLFSMMEGQIATIWYFFSIDGDRENVARDTFRTQFGGSPSYFYRFVLSAIAPMFVIWGLLAGILNKSRRLLLAASLLFIATMIGKFETLSKAPPAFFMIQLMVAAVLTLTNRITWRSVLGAIGLIGLVIYGVTRMTITIPEGIQGVEFIYYRVFEVENQSLLENFATFPQMHPHMWGANLRPVAMLMGVPYIPAYSIVAYTWHGTYDVTNPALFIADAWTDFSYAGVIVASLIVGAVCRLIDAFFLVHGKTIVNVVVLGATFIGVFTLLTTALNTALLSGGLLLAPILVGLLVAATRYFGRRNPTSSLGSTALGD
jgi:hypothetical protein